MSADMAKNIKCLFMVVIPEDLYFDIVGTSL